MNVNGTRKRPRPGRVASLPLSPSRLTLAASSLRDKQVLLRLGLTLVAIVGAWAALTAWQPPFNYHVGYVPPRNITARVEFSVDDPRALVTNTQKLLLYGKGEALAAADKELDAKTVDLLRQENREYLDQLPLDRIAERSLVMFALMGGLVTLCAYYLYYRQRRVLNNLPRLVLLLSSSVVALLLARATSADPWRAESIALLLFGMTMGIAHGREAALVLSLAVTLLYVVASGSSLGQLVLLIGVTAVAIVQLDRVRSRRKLIWVGLYAAMAALPLTVAAGIIDNQPLIGALFTHAAQNAVWALLSGFLITGLLPFIEGVFGVLTEISLLELGDVAHPLLQELVRRAPGTYNHSINVASIAEAAAETIGARGLLVRVGAYFHDIGKMLKPHYFVENQGLEGSRHDSLMPAMSTLIIIAHIKDGADLARQHRLPEPIIDLIQQHHGTTLVEYFYRRASERSEGDPDAAGVQESSFRYPGPKPQTVEAAVLMLADAVESASRALVEPTPARIESLVEEIALKKLLDGQFDECNLTLRQLRKIEDSLIKSLTAVYHGRVKYPDQRTA